MRRFLQRVLCALLSFSIAVGQPAFVLAQGLPASAPPAAVEGKALGESLLKGPSTDGGKIYFNGAGGTQSMDVSTLFQPAGSADDVEQMLEVFGDDPTAEELALTITERLATEDSAQANAYRTVRESALSRSHPDLGNDPVFDRSKEVMSSDNPIFSTFFAGCESVEVPVSGGSTVHVEDPRYCSRVITPVEHCEITHEYDAGLVRLVAGEGGSESCGEGCLDVYVGKVGDNYWSGNCTVFEQKVHLQVDNPAAIRSAVLTETRWDDHMQIFIGADKIWQGPNANEFPPETTGSCELSNNWTQTPNVDLTSHFQQTGRLEFLIRVSVTRGGEGYARIRILYDTDKVVTEDRWSISPECEALLDGLEDGACTLTAMNCLDGPPMATQCIEVNGYPVCQDDLSASPLPGYSSLCRRGEVNGNCRFMAGPMECWTDPNGQRQCPQNDGDNPNGCAMFEDDNCAFISSSCLPFAQGESGRCYAFEEKWDCGEDVSLPGSTATKMSCDGPIRCMGEECVSPTRESNPDFGKAAATLTAITYMGMEMSCSEDDPDSCTIFAGEGMECKQALGGYKDCCNVPVSTGMKDYFKLTTANLDLAQKSGLITKLASHGKDVYGGWHTVQNYLSSNTSQQTLTESFTSAWESISQSYGGATTESAGTLGLDALQEEITKAVAEFVADVFNPQVAEAFFSGTTTEGGEFIADGALSDTVTSVMNFIGWVYAVYVILNIIIDIVWACEPEEFMLAARREIKACMHVGKYCYDDTAFGCVETRDAYCCYASPLARIVMESAQEQLALDIGSPETPNCQGLTIAQVASLDWDRIDLEQWYGMLAANDAIPNSAPSFDSRYALDTVTRNELALSEAPSAPERIQNAVDAAEYFDEAREKVREDLWNGAD